MSKPLTDDEILNHFKWFFDPHECIVEVWDYGTKLRLRVRNNQEKVIASLPSVSLSSIRQLSDLEALCEGIALHIASRPTS